MQITMLQSADPGRYAQLLMLSSQTVQAYCALHGLNYEMTMSIRYGRKPWHAALNRITILKEYRDRGYDGWVVYIDADAVIVDLDFDLRSYLAERGQAALIAARSGVLPARWWDINNGVFAINLGHPLARQLVDAWHARLRSVPADALLAEERWGDVADDQEMMHGIMQHIEGLEQAVVHDEHPHVINWQGSFISQHVRASGSFSDRVENLARRVAVALARGEQGRTEHGGASHHAARADANAEFVAALYTVLLRREPDENGFRSAVHALNIGTVSYAQELRNCLSSPEFRLGVEAFLDHHIDTERRPSLT